MYKLIRRISSSFFPRPDRPWSEDATSTAPVIGRKRRNSSTEPEEHAAKRNRTETEIEAEDREEGPSSGPATQREESQGEDVKEVTEGVREVELDDKKDVPAVPAETAAAVPLPESPELQAQKEEVEEEKDIPEVAASQEQISAEAETEKVEEEKSEEIPEVNGVHQEKDDSPSAVDDSAAASETSTKVEDNDSNDDDDGDSPAPAATNPKAKVDTIPDVLEEGEINAL